MTQKKKRAYTKPVGPRTYRNGQRKSPAKEAAILATYLSGQSYRATAAKHGVSVGLVVRLVKRVMGR